MEATITTDGERILAQIPFANGSGPKWARKVPGAKAKYDEGPPKRFIAWSYPLTMETCRTFRRVFGRNLEVLPALVRWAQEAIEIEQAMEGMRSGTTTVDLSRVREMAPQLYLAMDSRPYQIAGTSFLVTAGQALLGDQPGLGKTLQTLATLVQKNCRRILVLCPKSATYNVWVRETERWAPSIKPYRAQGDRKQRELVMTDFAATKIDFSRLGQMVPQRMLICNLEMMRAKRTWICRDETQAEWTKPPMRKGGCKMAHDHKVRVDYEYPFLFSQKWDAIVLDESHNALASTKNTMSKDITQIRLGAMHLRKRLAENGLALAMSGTPARSKLPRFWGTLNWLRPDVFTSFWNFAKAHFDVDEGDGYSLEVSADPSDPEAFDKALRPYYLARTKADVAKDLPPITYAGTPPTDNPDGLNGVWLDMDDRQAKAYREMVDMAQATIEGGTLSANGVLAEIMRRRQFACTYGSLDADGNFSPVGPSNKLEWILEFLQERAGHEGKVVIASAFTKIVMMFAREIEAAGYQVLTLTGNTTDRGRQDLVRRFADPDDPARVCILNTYAGGEAITLDACCDDMIFTDLPWTSDQAEQVESRIHRVSRVHNVTVYRLMSRGTIDEWMAGTNDEQRQRMLSAKPKALKEMP
jgi:SNF2 family DNA or RNA helicase